VPTEFSSAMKAVYVQSTGSCALNVSTATNIYNAMYFVVGVCLKNSNNQYVSYSCAADGSSVATLICDSNCSNCVLNKRDNSAACINLGAYYETQFCATGLDYVPYVASTTSVSTSSSSTTTTDTGASTGSSTDTGASTGSSTDTGATTGSSTTNTSTSASSTSNTSTTASSSSSASSTTSSDSSSSSSSSSSTTESDSSNSIINIPPILMVFVVCAFFLMF